MVFSTFISTVIIRVVVFTTYLSFRVINIQYTFLAVGILQCCNG